MKPIIDTHIHLDMYEEAYREQMLSELDRYSITHLISVSNNLNSSLKNLTWSMQDQRIKPATGFHPEQNIPTDQEIEQMTSLIHRYANRIVAIGEVGLPYYTRKKNPGVGLSPYVELLEHFLLLAKELDKPVVLHAIYEDADLVCDLLEKHDMTRAHFHWFKGFNTTIDRMKENGYFISVTPDCVYEKEIQSLIKIYPLDQLMVETDGPWAFDGPFKGKVTHPKMIHDSVEKISELKGLPVENIYGQLYKNTIDFYKIDSF
ncbi:TatD family hydrolase [Halobacillus mangrovi]|uniref:DNAase n=1 Tax=Halobacillus mangrovi TaxID=402384 RepID=A0A1W5ZYP9_9BACI|nr:TatD family hydrolase [Halobacillus mangrovi]ARI78465.1 DNAase [Halobacillus mangrovi]